MSTATHLRTAIAIAALSIVAASPVLAQGNGKAKGKANKGQESAQVQRERPTLQRRGNEAAALRPRAEDRADDRYEDRGEYDRRDRSRVEDILRGDDDRRDRSRVEDILRGDDDRRQRRNVPPGWCKGRGNPHNTPENCGYSSNRRYEDDRDDRYGGSGSYAEAHTAFHRALDREYSARAAERRADPLYQIRLRAEKAAEHDRWHERMGTRH